MTDANDPEAAKAAQPSDAHALAGLRVLELGQLLAGPFAGFLLAGFGADVIKVEPPDGGDPLRRWRRLEDGTSLWWRSLARNKRCVTADLRAPEGGALVKRLIARGIDVVIENFRPGRLESWGLGPADLWAIDPRIVIVRISGYGQTGPLATKPGFANVAEAFGGLRYTTGEPERPPVRTGVSLGDSLAGLHAAFGAMVALRERDRSGRGQVVDTALFESVFSMMESLLPEYDRHGFVRERSGSSLPGIVPSNTYRCLDGWVVLGANKDGPFQRLMVAIGRRDLADDPRFAHDDGRSRHMAEIDDAIASWAATHSQADALALLERAEVPSGPILSIAEIAKDPHYTARGMFEHVTLPDGSPLAVPRIAPLLSRTPATAQTAGPDLGTHNDDVWRSVGLSAEELADLRARGIV